MCARPDGVEHGGRQVEAGGQHRVGAFRAFAESLDDVDQFDGVHPAQGPQRPQGHHPGRGIPGDRVVDGRVEKPHHMAVVAEAELEFRQERLGCHAHGRKGPDLGVERTESGLELPEDESRSVVELSQAQDPAEGGLLSGVLPGRAETVVHGQNDIGAGSPRGRNRAKAARAGVPAARSGDPNELRIGA